MSTDRRRLILSMSMSLDGFAARRERAWPGPTSPTGALMNALPKLVLSSTTTTLDWEGTELSTRPVPDEIPVRTTQPGRDLVVFGGASFARSLAVQGLIDGHHVDVQPVALGDGLPLLHVLPEPMPLTLASSVARGGGTVTQTDEPR